MAWPAVASGRAPELSTTRRQLRETRGGAPRRRKTCMAARASLAYLTAPPLNPAQNVLRLIDQERRKGRQFPFVCGKPRRSFKKKLRRRKRREMRRRNRACAGVRRGRSSAQPPPHGTQRRNALCLLMACAAAPREPDTSFAAHPNARRRRANPNPLLAGRSSLAYHS
jgi:hypothetical protein